MTLTRVTVEAWHDRAVQEVLPEGRDVATDAERVDLLSKLEELKNTICAVQADLAVDLAASQRAQQAAAGVAAERQGRGIALQLGLARRESPHRGQVLLGLAQTLRAELPHTHAALKAGWLSEFRATLIARETACLRVEDRREVDEAVCADPATLDGVGTRGLLGMLRGHAARLDPAAVAARARKAEADRGVSLRPAPDTMSYLTGALPVAQGVACYAALLKAALAAKAEGDERTKAQLMADVLVERLTGQTHAADVPVTVNVVISDTALFGGGHNAADVPGYGPVPAEVARHLAAHSMSSDAVTFIRGLYADPHGRLVAMTSTRRFHSETLAEFLRLRDQGICRTPWCDAPVAHADHIHPAEHGGETSAENGQGLCQACNLAKQAPGWTQTTHTGPTHTVATTTPTGHRHRSAAPRAPDPARPPTRPATTPTTPAERRVADFLHRLDLAWVP